MIPALNIVTIVVILIVSFLLPLVVAFVVWRRTKASPINALVGAAVFFVCYIIAVATSMLGSMLIASPIILTLLLALRAGLVEEFGRFLAFKFFLKRRKNTSDGFMYGVGHGGIEVWLTLTLAMLNNLLFAVMFNAGGLEALEALAPGQATILQDVIRQLTEASPWLLSVGLVERIIAMVLHISLSVIVFVAVRQRKWLYLVLAIALHFLADASITLYVTEVLNIWTFELVLAAEVLIIALIAWRIAKTYRVPDDAPPSDVAPTDAAEVQPA